VIVLKHQVENGPLKRDSVTRFFAFGFFDESASPQPQSIALGPFRIFSKIRGDNRKSRCTTGVNDTGGKFATGVNDTGGKIAASINDTGGKFVTGVSDTGENFSTNFASVVDTGGKFVGVNDTGGKFATGVNDAGGKLPPVSTTPAANLPPVSLTPVAMINNGYNIRLQSS
jgi:hypothetical protein